MARKSLAQCLIHSHHMTNVASVMTAAENSCPLMTVLLFLFHSPMEWHLRSHRFESTSLTTLTSWTHGLTSRAWLLECRAGLGCAKVKGSLLKDFLVPVSAPLLPVWPWASHLNSLCLTTQNSSWNSKCSINTSWLIKRQNQEVFFLLACTDRDSFIFLLSIIPVSCTFRYLNSLT